MRKSIQRPNVSCSGLRWDCQIARTRSLNCLPDLASAFESIDPRIRVEREHLQLRIGAISFSQLLRIRKVLVFPTAEQGENIGWPFTPRPLPDRLGYPLARRLPRSFRVALDQLLGLVIQIDGDLTHIIAIGRVRLT